LAINEIYVEKLLCEDAAKIVVDEEFKYDLKNKIMFGDKYNNITESPKRKSNYKKNRYLKIASGFAICVFVGGSIFKVMDIQNKSFFTKSEGTSDVTMPIASIKGLTKTNNSATNALNTLDAIIKNNYKNKQQMAIQSGKDNTVVGTVTVAENVDKKGATINKIVGDVNNKVGEVSSDASINQGLGNAVEHASPSTNVDVPVDVPDAGNVDNSYVPVTLTAYDSRYSPDAKKIVNVKDGGIYIKNLKSSQEEKLVAYDVKTQIVDKPNLTPNDDVIYYKADKVKLDNGVSSEENGAIYLAVKNGKTPTKIVDGKNPMVSKDGKELVYESEGKIYIQSLGTDTSRYIANGKYPAFSDDGKLVSYVKEEIEPQSPIAMMAKIANIEKTNSTLCVIDPATGKTQGITDKGVDVEDNSIKSWAGSTTISDEANSSGYSYLQSIWSADNKEVYVIKRDNESNVSTVSNFKLDN